MNISGIVIHGKKLGRTIGFPTANINIDNSDIIISTQTGIYAIKIEIDKVWYNGVANYGYRPTVNVVNIPLLEVYIFDFNQNIYDKHVSVSFIEFIRSEKKFDSLELMIDQIKLDCINAKKLLNI